MKREIKFRVWDNVDYMSKTFTFQDIIERSIEFTPDCKVMQFTGLKDMNGTEIYEGDILSTKPPYVVSFDNGEFCLFSRLGKWGSVSNLKDVSEKLNTKLSVIGNIYQNPEMLQQ